jgi:hypothetical protein
MNSVRARDKLVGRRQEIFNDPQLADLAFAVPSCSLDHSFFHSASADRTVIPAQAGIQPREAQTQNLDSGFRRNDEKSAPFRPNPARP